MITAVLAGGSGKCRQWYCKEEMLAEIEFKKARLTSKQCQAFAIKPAARPLLRSSSV
jgi:hypothetical protein